MGLGRRKIRLEDEDAWIFNRMADVYDARPAYPAALISALAALGHSAGSHVVDVGAGIGHLSLPLSAQGFDVVALEPARAMLDRLRLRAQACDRALRCVHATAEAMPLESASADLVIVADALHFLDAERTAGEIRRVLAPQGALALVICELADTPFMRSVVEIMNEAAPRRPRDVRQAIAQVSAAAQVPLADTQTFDDATPVDGASLERILRSISFIGPAMNAERFAQFRARIHALPQAPVWARRFTLHSGRKRA
jgi:ubiquinone/menaquinone biosynthesis C-methylase UbiE